MEDPTPEEARIGSKLTPSKPDIVRRLLTRKAGGSLAEISQATAWQPHSVRAYISGLRKGGATIVLEPRKDGVKAYRSIKRAEANADA